ncbi:MAG TPA: mannosyltransferase family protein [Thermomicrobiales bacterium]|nr:mannosyltransferase family protein [Thermomicrobiales bacterium]
MTSRPATARTSRSRSGALTPLQTLRAFARQQGLELPALVFVLHWIVVAGSAALATRYARRLDTVPAVGWYLPERDGLGELFIQPLRNWDGFWYSLISTEGYDFHSASTAFWPLYPWSMRVVSDIFFIRVETAGLILANLAFFLALVVFRRLVSREWGVDVANRALWLLAFFPTAFYFSAVYSESFFLLFTLLAYYWAIGGKWWLAGLAALLAALTRNVGVLLVVPLGIIFLKQFGINPRHWPRSWLALVLPGLGPLLYMLVLLRIYRDPLETIEAQKGWAREQAMPLTTFQMAFDQLDLGWLHALIDSPSWTTLTSHTVRFGFAEFESLDIAFALLAIPLLIYCLLKLPIEYAIFPLMLYLIPLFSPSTIHPLMSMSRFLIVMFPLFIGLALLTRRQMSFRLALVPSIVLLALLTVQFSTWYWVA